MDTTPVDQPSSEFKELMRQLTAEEAQKAYDEAEPINLPNGYVERMVNDIIEQDMKRKREEALLTLIFGKEDGTQVVEN